MISVLFVACSTKQKKEVLFDYDSNLPREFVEVLKAQGGLEKWRSYKTLEYDLLHENDSVPTEHYILDLITRKDLTVADSFKIGFDGKEVWVAPTRASFKGKSARFYHNLFSYFLTIPFIVADPGAHYTIDTLTIDGKRFETIQINFDEGVGDASKDYYKLLIDPTTHRFEKILYTVTYYSGEPHENYNLLSYEDFIDVNGILLPSRLVGYKYGNGATGEKRYETHFKNMEFKSESPDQTIFRMPAIAEIDSLKKN